MDKGKQVNTQIWMLEIIQTFLIRDAHGYTPTRLYACPFAVCMSIHLCPYASAFHFKHNKNRRNR